MSAQTRKVEEQMAVINAGRVIPSDDPTISRFRFLLSEISSSSGASDADIADQLSAGRRVLRDRVGKDVRLLELTEAEYSSRALIRKGRLSEYIAQLVALKGKR